MAALVNNHNKAFSAVSGTTITLAAFTPGGSNRVLYAFVGCGGSSPAAPTSVTFGGVAMSQISTTLTVSSFARFTLWRLIAPAASSGDIVATWAGSQDERFVVGIATENTDQTTPNNTVATATGTNTTPSVNATSVNGDLVLDGEFSLDTGGTARTLLVGANQTSLEEIEGADTSFETLGSSKETATGTSTTMSWTLSGAVDAWGIFGFAVNGLAGSPTIDDVDTDEIITSDQTGVNYTGTNLGATTGDRTIELVQSAVAVTQTQSAGNSTSGTVSIVTERVGTDIKFGSANFRVTVTAGGAQASLGVTVNPPSGQLYIDMSTPNTTAANRITAVADIASGDQLHARGVGGGVAPAGLTLLSDGTFYFTAGNAPASFDVRVWSTADQTWGAFATQTISFDASLMAAIVPQQTMVRYAKTKVVASGFKPVNLLR